MEITAIGSICTSGLYSYPFVSEVLGALKAYRTEHAPRSFRAKQGVFGFTLSVLILQTPLFQHACTSLPQMKNEMLWFPARLLCPCSTDHYMPSTHVAIWGSLPQTLLRPCMGSVGAVNSSNHVLNNFTFTFACTDQSLLSLDESLAASPFHSCSCHSRVMVTQAG